MAQVSTDPRWAAAAPSDGITAGTVFTLTGEGAVFTEISLGARCEVETYQGPSLLHSEDLIMVIVYRCVCVCDEPALTLVADDARPSVGAIAAIFP